MGPCGPGRNPRYFMAMIKKVRNRLERGGILQGWRMRWHMQ
ncbi:MAG: hypothetical protein QOD55_2716 [Solirubrobacteraceae bacterium]|jgi:hypothetical protein|nr:hypothetical protein [Solirubrobacteraceae bacterium]